MMSDEQKKQAFEFAKDLYMRNKSFVMTEGGITCEMAVAEALNFIEEFDAAVDAIALRRDSERPCFGTEYRETRGMSGVCLRCRAYTMCCVEMFKKQGAA